MAGPGSPATAARWTRRPSGTAATCSSAALLICLRHESADTRKSARSSQEQRIRSAAPALGVAHLWSRADADARNSQRRARPRKPHGYLQAAAIGWPPLATEPRWQGGGRRFESVEGFLIPDCSAIVFVFRADADRLFRCLRSVHRRPRVELEPFNASLNSIACSQQSRAVDAEHRPAV